MATSWFSYTQTIYCTKSWYAYEILKEVTGKILYSYSHGKESIEIKEETCEDLINQCKTKFGDAFQYVQSGVPYGSAWDTVTASGVICQHLYADDHDDDYDHYDI